jgi:cell division protein FtsW (lipid II flippase)
VSAATLAPAGPAAPAFGRRRGAELALVVFAIVITLTSYAAVRLAHTKHLPTDMVTYGLGLAALFGAAHFVVRRFAPYADPVLLPIAAALNGLGLVLIWRLDLAAQDKAKALHQAAPRGAAPLQLVWMCLGVALFIAVLVLVRDHRRLQSYSYTAMFVGLVLLVLPAVLPASHSVVNGARIWVRFGAFSFQPGEIAKLALEVFFAGYLVRHRDLLRLAGRRVWRIELPRARDLGPLLLAWGASLLVLLRESDLGSSLLFFGIFLVVLYVATERGSWLLLGLVLFVIGSVFAFYTIGHVHDRFEAWLHPFSNAIYHKKFGSSYQLDQGLFGMATGGITGTGLGQGRPNLVPFANTDFIMASLGEELGLAGVMSVLTFYLLFVGRGLRAAVGARDGFGKLLATGLAFGFALQVFVQVGGVTRLIPLTGLTLPFVSYGGSSLVTNWVLLALLLRISDAGRRPQPVRAPAPTPDENATVVVRR